MNIAPFPFQITNWEKIEVTEYSGETGKAYWKPNILVKKGTK